jgi:hypothetical protein
MRHRPVDSVSLAAREARGGLAGGRGYAYQDAYIAAAASQWLATSGFDCFLKEGLGDVEVLFRSDGADSRWYYQIKDFVITPSEFGTVVATFQAKDRKLPGGYVRFVLACPDLQGRLRDLTELAEETRGSEGFYNGSTRQVIESTLADIQRRADSLRLEVGAKFLVEKLVVDRRLPRDRFGQLSRLLFTEALAAQKQWGSVDRALLRQAYDSVTALVHEAHRSRITRARICSTIRQAIGRAQAGSSAAVAATQAAVRRYRKRLRDNILRESEHPLGLFRWSLYALPIRCREHVLDDSYVRTVPCEHLLDEAGRRVLLTGPPASGKTTACRRLMANPPARCIPVDIGHLLPCSADEVLDFVAREARLGDAARAKDLEGSGRILLIVDGLGEKRKVAQAVRALHGLIADLRASRFLVTCRTHDYQQEWLPPFERWEVMPLADEEQEEFLKTQPARLKRRVQRWFRRTQGLREVCRNQFLFLMAVRLLSEAEPRKVLPTRAGLYGGFLSEFLREWMKLPVWAVEPVRVCLQELAVEMRRSSGDRTRLTTDQVRQCLRRCSPGARDRDIEEQFGDLRRLGLIEETDGSVRFFQETYQEYLCAEWLNRQRILPRDFERLPDGRWLRDAHISDVSYSFYCELAGIAQT